MIHEKFRSAIKWYGIRVRVKEQVGGGGGRGWGVTEGGIRKIPEHKR